MPIRFTSFILGLVLSSVAVAQKADSMLDRRFSGGRKEFYRHVANDFRLPSAARSTSSNGTVVVSMVLDSAGHISAITHHTSLHREIAREIDRTLKKSEKFWQRSNQNDTCFIVFVVSLGANQFRVNQPPPHFMSPVTINAFSAPATERAIEPDGDLFKRYVAAKVKQDYEKARTLMTDLIKRNPLNPVWFAERIAMSKLLNDQEQVCADQRFLKAVLRTNTEVDCRGTVSEK